MKKYEPTTFFLKTYGCQANEADSAKTAGILHAVGMEQVVDVEKADVFIINSCSVRQKSEDKVYGWGKILTRIEKKPFVVLMGCMVGSTMGERIRYPFEELEKRTPWVDLYVSPSEISSLPLLLKKKGIPINLADKPDWESSGFLPEGSDNTGYVNVSYGCDNFCSYCVVPYARGKEVSRSREEIVGEVQSLLKKGIKHIVLCGQNVNSWNLSAEEKRKIRIGDDTKLPFADLLREVHYLAGIEKLSFISSNPFDFTSDLIQTLKLPKIENYLHIAVQSGNNDVLSRMNRRYTVEEFIDLVNRIKEARPDIRLGTDIIVGFPGETWDQFQDTVNLVLQVGFVVAYISMYSPRPGTAAARLYEDNVPLSEKRRRHALLTRLWKESTEK